MSLTELPPLAEHLMELAARATERARARKFEAEITAQPAKWHVIVTEPNRERTAASHLIGRCFGIYLPEFDEVIITRARKRTVHQLMFPGYVFAFVWAIETQWARIAACTGVTRMLLNGDKPAVLPDHLINEIQTQEFNRLVNNTAILAHSEPPRRKRMRRWERELRAKAVDQFRGENTFRVSTKSYLGKIEHGDGAARNGALHRALGLV